MSVRRLLLIVTALIGLNASVAFGLPAVQTFEDGTTQGWISGGGPSGGGAPFPPTNIGSGGPSGVDDSFLQITGTGLPGPGGRLVANNFTEWGGDYATVGVDFISMDLKNLGSSDLYVRLLLENPLVGPPTDVAITDAFFLPAGSDWQGYAFSVQPSDLIVLAGDVDALLSDVTALRIFSSQAPIFPADPLAGVLGVDNIGVAIPTPVPEPASGLLVLVAFAGIALRRHP